jgi:hypothetical protein
VALRRCVWSNADRTEVFEIFGFSDAAPSFDEFEEALVDDDGSFMFAEAIREKPGDPLDMYTVGFAFNVNLEREWAVYRATQAMYGEEQPFTRDVGSFIEFLAEAVENGASYPRLPSVGGNSSTA